MTDLIRQWHAQHPRGTSMKDLGSKVFGTSPDVLPPYPKMLALHEWMLTRGWKPGMKLPSAKDLGH